MENEKFDKVMMESPEEGTKELTPVQFRAIPIAKRVDMLVKGHFKFYKGGEPVSPMQALKVS